jgi:hypothetical protein
VTTSYTGQFLAPIVDVGAPHPTNMGGPPHTPQS